MEFNRFVNSLPLHCQSCFRHHIVPSRGLRWDPQFVDQPRGDEVVSGSTINHNNHRSRISALIFIVLGEEIPAMEFSDSIATCAASCMTSSGENSSSSTNSPSSLLAYTNNNRTSF